VQYLWKHVPSHVHERHDAELDCQVRVDSSSSRSISRVVGMTPMRSREAIAQFTRAAKMAGMDSKKAESDAMAKALMDGSIHMEGSKDDVGKARWDLVPWGAMAHVVLVLTHGAFKYGAHNWRHVKEWRWRYDAALERHLVAWRLGENFDPDSRLPHLAHAACCVLFLLAMDVKESKP
jgi:Domain of unknown function (DUF5664)